MIKFFYKNSNTTISVEISFVSIMTLINMLKALSDYL